MRTGQLLKRNLTYYWRPNLAVVAGVAIAVAVLAGALLVGDSVRASLRILFLQRLGNADHIVVANSFFREQLAVDIQNHRSFGAAGLDATSPLIVLDGTITHELSGRLASGIKVYGVDQRFWTFHARQNHAPSNREILLSESLASELGSRVGDALLLRVQKPSEIPIESLHSRKEDLGRTLRLEMREALSAAELGEFSVQPQQSATRAVFVPLVLLQKELEQQGKVNLILIAGKKRPESASGGVATQELIRILNETTSLEDFGIKLRLLPEQQSISLEHDSKLLNDSLSATATDTATRQSLRVTSVLSYLANGISFGERSIPYSLVTALDEKSFDALRRGEAGTERKEPGGKSKINFSVVPTSSHTTSSAGPTIILNEWAARDLGVREGATVSLEYYVWHESGRLETKKAEFQLLGVVPIAGIAADRDLVPEYRGITGSESLSEWDPPFPIDLQRVREQDEAYWHQYRTTPKAFISLRAGQELWQSRFGKLTSLRLTPMTGTPLQQTLDSYGQQLKASLDPARMGFSVIPVRHQGLEASQGATDFGEYFLYFSFFLVMSALLLSALFFKLGVEQRLREIGVLQSIGFPAARVRKLFLLEGVVLSVIGSLVGVAGALAYGQLMMRGLSTWWVDAVGTTMLTLHVVPLSLLLGAMGGVAAALLCIVWTLRRLGDETIRSLLTGSLAGEKSGAGEAGEERMSLRHRLFASLRRTVPTPPCLTIPPAPRRRRALHFAIAFTFLGIGLLIATSLRFVGQVAGFFGSGVVLLAAILCYLSEWLRRDRRKPIHGTGSWPIMQLGFRNTTYRPGRSVLCIALIASAAFIIVSVDAFRRAEKTPLLDRKSGSGGFPLLAESLLPLVHDPNTREGREALNLTTDRSSDVFSGVIFTRFRVRPGDDASCLNLYQPRNPRIVAPPDDFIQSNRFAFQDSLGSNDEEKQNPWLLLNRELPDGATPVIADANSLTYVLHLKLGDDLVLNGQSGPVRLRVVAELADSIFQSELLMAEKNFLHLFPEQEGYRFFLIDVPAAEQSSTIATDLEDRLSDLGFDVVPTSERLANFHRVENTYLSTFQMLGGLGLILGTLGLAAVLLRNVLERRRELALLRAIGYNSSHFALMVVAENVMLLGCGLLTGTVCALLAIAPAFLNRGGSLPNSSLGLLLLAVLVSGLIASLVATWATLKSPLLPALRTE